MAFRIKTSVFLALQRYCSCLPSPVSRALFITSIRFGSLLLIFGTFLYLAILSSQAAHNHRGRRSDLLSNLTLIQECDDKIRGVNLGGWLVLEPWITPLIFEEVNVGPLDGLILDEYTYFQHVPKDTALERLDRHWNEFYQKEDLVILAQSGITHLRIPIGHWVFDVSENEPFPEPPKNDEHRQRFYLRRLIQWAESLNLKVLLDLHAAPGSQNGFDNSGRMGPIGWLKDGNVERTLRTIGNMALMVSEWIRTFTIKKETIFGIGILNEPGGQFDQIWTKIMEDFYPKAYQTLRLIDPEGNIAMVIDSAFRSSDNFINYMDSNINVYVDIHHYQGFGSYWNSMAMDLPDGWLNHYRHTCRWKMNLEKQTLPSIVGEWSLAITDCQKYLHNGYQTPYVAPDAGKDSRICKYYNSDFDLYSNEYKEFLKKYMILQMESYEAGSGWFFWTAKTENHCAPEWDYLFLLKNDIAPKNLCQKMNLCHEVKH